MDLHEKTKLPEGFLIAAWAHKRINARRYLPTPLAGCSKGQGIHGILPRADARAAGNWGVETDKNRCEMETERDKEIEKRRKRNTHTHHHHHHHHRRRHHHHHHHNNNKNALFLSRLLLLTTPVVKLGHHSRVSASLRHKHGGPSRGCRLIPAEYIIAQRPPPDT